MEAVISSRKVFVVGRRGSRKQLDERSRIFKRPQDHRKLTLGIKKIWETADELRLCYHFKTKTKRATPTANVKANMEKARPAMAP